MAIAPRYLLPSEAARRLGVSRSAILNWTNTGRLRVAMRASGVRLLDSRDVERLKRQRERQNGKAVSK